MFSFVFLALDFEYLAFTFGSPVSSAALDRGRVSVQQAAELRAIRNKAANDIHAIREKQKHVVKVAKAKATARAKVAAAKAALAATRSSI